MRILISVGDKEKAKGEQSEYFKALVSAGAQKAELVLAGPADKTRVLAKDYDGVLFTGGEDVDPAFYGEEKKYDNVRVDAARDKFEMAVLDRALDRRLPILGICRGAQVINVKFGGSLYQDLKAEVPLEDTPIVLEHRQEGSRSESTHSVTVTEPDSRVGAAVAGSCRVNSLHHQAIKRLGHGLKVTAHAEDGLVEAIEAADDYPFLVAVQWHPEEMVAEHAEQKKIFQDFLAKCREAAERRGPAPR